MEVWRSKKNIFVPNAKTTRQNANGAIDVMAKGSCPAGIFAKNAMASFWQTTKICLFAIHAKQEFFS
jgi:hypothetical protein